MCDDSLLPPRRRFGRLTTFAPSQSISLSPWNIPFRGDMQKPPISISLRLGAPSVLAVVQPRLLRAQMALDHLWLRKHGCWLVQGL
jgi:hypothetical protein